MAATLATPANMSEYERRNPRGAFGSSAFAFSPGTGEEYSAGAGEEYSAGAGDYWNRPADEPLLDSESEPMVLVVRTCILTDALTGEQA